MTSRQAKITIVHLKESFRENKSRNYISYADIQSALPDIMDKETCSLEVLSQPKRKIYMDIENIPFDKTNVIYDIVNKFSSFMKIPTDGCCLTYNKKSTQHSGLSYHVIFPYVMDINDMKKSVLLFKTLNPEYEHYIDASVYSILRLFRLPMNGKVTGSGIDHDDCHEVIRGKFEDSFIQLTENLPIISENMLPNGFDDFNAEDLVKTKCKTTKRFKQSNNYKLDEFSDAVMIEFQKLKSTLDAMQEQNKKLEKMNDILFLKILELEKSKK